MTRCDASEAGTAVRANWTEKEANVLIVVHTFCLEGRAVACTFIDEGNVDQMDQGDKDRGQWN